jgi:hypothetical protein
MPISRKRSDLVFNRSIIATPSFPHPSEPAWTQAHQKILKAFEQEENRQLPLRTLYRRGGINKHIWYEALKESRFVTALEALGVPVSRQGKRHIQVDLAPHPEEELAKDVWDIRSLKSDYPKHRAPGDFKVDFTWISNPLLRQQVKDYFRHQLMRWEPKTFSWNLACLRRFLVFLPPDIHVGMLSREMVEEILPKLTQWSDYAVRRCLQATRAMLTYMATSPAWTGPRPARFLIWDEDIPARPDTLPRPVPPQVLDQLDVLLEKAVEAMKQNRPPWLLPPLHWEAILILRYTGMRAEDLAHLKAPDEHGHNGCLDQDSDGYWWIRLHHSISKMNKDHRIPTRASDGVIDAVRRQWTRSKEIPDHFLENTTSFDMKGASSLTIHCSRRSENSLPTFPTKIALTALLLTNFATRWQPI